MKLAHVAALATIRALRIAFLLPISAVAEASRLNVLLILAEDLGYSDLGPCRASRFPACSKAPTWCARFTPIGTTPGLPSRSRCAIPRTCS